MIVFLSNSSNTQDLYEWLLKNEKDVCLFSGRLAMEHIHSLKPSMIISYNYKYIIGEEIISHMKDKIINLHISLLPWNRGSHPNVWSFIENTPKGVTIHQIDSGLDTGAVLLQKEVWFDTKTETLATSYMKLQNEIQQMFRENWPLIKSGEILPRRPSGTGTMHYKKDLKKFEKILDFNEPIDGFLKKVRAIYTEQWSENE